MIKPKNSVETEICLPGVPYSRKEKHRHNIFSSDGSLLDGSKSKSGAVREIATEVEPTDQIANKLDCV